MLYIRYMYVTLTYFVRIKNARYAFLITLIQGIILRTFICNSKYLTTRRIKSAKLQFQRSWIIKNFFIVFNFFFSIIYINHFYLIYAKINSFFKILSFLREKNWATLEQFSAIKVDNFLDKNVIALINFSN